MLAEAAWEHAERLETHADLYSPGVRMRLEMGRYVLAEDYVRGMRIREALAREVDKALEGRDALLLPTMALPAPLIGAATVEVDGVTQPVRAAMLKLTQLFNMTGHPAIALPAGDGADGLPRSLQLVGSPRPYRAPAGSRDRDRASDRHRTGIGRRRHRVNVRPILADVWLSRRDGLVHGWRMSDHVRRTRYIRYRRLFDHAQDRARVLPVD